MNLEVCKDVERNWPQGDDFECVIDCVLHRFYTGTHNTSISQITKTSHWTFVNMSKTYLVHFLVFLHNENSVVQKHFTLDSCNRLIYKRECLYRLTFLYAHKEKSKLDHGCCYNSIKGLKNNNSEKSWFFLLR